MKLQIIYLEHFDDRTSAAEKLNWVRADRVLLVWPARGEVMASRLDLKLLQRQANSLQVQLGLVSHHPSVRRHAHDLGLPVFDDLDHLPEDRWQAAHPPSRPPLEQSEPALIRREMLNLRYEASPDGSGLSFPARRAFLGLGLGAVFVLAAAVYPSARVIVSPETRRIEFTREIPLDTGDLHPAPIGVLPMMVRSTVVEGSHRVAAAALRSSPSSTRRPTITNSDISDLDAELESRLLDAAEQNLENQLAPSERLLVGSLSIQQVLSRELDAEPGDLAATVGLQMQIEVAGLVLEESSLVEFVQMGLENQLPDSWAIVPGSMRYDLVEFMREGQPRLEIHASLRGYQPLRFERIRSNLPGERVEQASQEVRRLQAVNDATIDLSPSWFPWLPALPNRITVEYPW